MFRDDSSRNEAVMEPDQLERLRELCAKNTERQGRGWRWVRRLGVLIGVLRAIRQNKGKPRHGS